MYRDGWPHLVRNILIIVVVVGLVAWGTWHRWGGMPQVVLSHRQWVGQAVTFCLLGIGVGVLLRSRAT